MVKIRAVTDTSAKPPTTGAPPNRRAPLLARLLTVELVFILIEFISGVYMVFAGINTAGVAVHAVFGVLAGVLGIVCVVYAYRTPELKVATYTLLGLVFVVVAGIGGLLYIRGVSPPDAYLALMGLGFVLSGAFYSIPLGRLNRYARTAKTQ